MPRPSAFLASFRVTGRAVASFNPLTPTGLLQPSVMIMGRRTRFCRSRTLPGQPRRVIALRPGAPHRIDPAIFGGKPDQGFLHEGGEIYPTLPQRWQIEQHHRQPEEQVLPEAPFGDPLFQVGIGGATIGVSIWKSSRSPTRYSRLSWRKRSSFTCTEAGRSFSYFFKFSIWQTCRPFRNPYVNSPNSLKKSAIPRVKP